MDYTKEEFNAVLNVIYTDLIKDKENNLLEATLTGGQPGAGKSLINDILTTKNKNLITINGDEFRTYHPKYEKLIKEYGNDSVLHTQKFAGEMTEALIDKLSDNKYGLIIEGTLRTSEIPLKTKNLLEGKGL